MKMRPRLHASTTRSGYVGDIIECISGFDCSQYFTNHIGLSQPEQKVIVDRFQRELCNSLSVAVSTVQWQIEYIPSTNQRDSIDIFGECSEAKIVIELDKHRVDQVAKKFVSRNSLLINETVFFVSLCYPGTSRMNASECIKYFGYCANLSTRMTNQYAGFIVE